MTTRADTAGPGGTAYNAFLSACPSRLLLDRLANKWVVLVLCALGGDADKAPDAPAVPTALLPAVLEPVPPVPGAAPQ